MVGEFHCQIKTYKGKVATLINIKECSVNQKVGPSPRTLSTPISPPWPLIICSEIYSKAGSLIIAFLDLVIPVKKMRNIIQRYASPLICDQYLYRIYFSTLIAISSEAGVYLSAFLWGIIQDTGADYLFFCAIP
jgi:hypothetical protein